MNIRYLTKASLIAAIYIVLVVIQVLPYPVVGLTFGPVQLRLAEGLAILPLVESAAIPGLFVGCLLSNLILASFSGFGILKGKTFKINSVKFVNFLKTKVAF